MLVNIKQILKKNNLKVRLLSWGGGGGWGAYFRRAPTFGGRYFRGVPTFGGRLLSGGAYFRGAPTFGGAYFRSFFSSLLKMRLLSGGGGRGLLSGAPTIGPLRYLIYYYLILRFPIGCS